MENSAKPPALDAISRTVAKALFREQPAETVAWVGSCCGRVSVTVLARPTKCGTCGKPAEVIEVRADDLTR